MTNRDLIKKIKQLEKIQPSKNWLDLTRHNLVSQISFEEKDQGLKSSFGFFNWLKEPQSAALVVCLLVIFIVGPWLTIKASQPSLPGELLYSVKRASEGIQTTVASEQSKTKLKFEFANRRLEELTKISQDSFSEEEKSQKARELIGNFKDNLASLSKHISNIPKEEAVAVAERTKKIKEELDRTKEEVSLDIQNDLAEAEKVVEEVEKQILAVLTGNQEETVGQAATTTSDQEILIFLEETDFGTMTTTEEIINEIEE